MFLELPDRYDVDLNCKKKDVKRDCVFVELSTFSRWPSRDSNEPANFQSWSNISIESRYSFVIYLLIFRSTLYPPGNSNNVKFERKTLSV
jgi:hypothetical protein